MQREALDEVSGEVTSLQTEYTKSYSNDALVEELVAALKVHLGHSRRVNFWWCCDGDRCAGLGLFVRSVLCGGCLRVRFDVCYAVFLVLPTSDTRCPESDDIPIGRGSRS